MSNPSETRLPFGLSIRPANTDDIEQIVALSSAVSLAQSSDARGGFLVSGYSDQVYRDALALGLSSEGGPYASILGGFDQQNELAGFVFGYEADYGRRFMSGSTEATIDGHFGHRYYILKQIAVAARWRGRGVGEALAEAFLHALPADAEVFLTIVSEPANPASEQFHAKLGFEPVLASTSHGGGITYPSRIWRRTHSGS